MPVMRLPPKTALRVLTLCVWAIASLASEATAQTDETPDVPPPPVEQPTPEAETAPAETAPAEAPEAAPEAPPASEPAETEVAPSPPPEPMAQAELSAETRRDPPAPSRPSPGAPRSPSPSGETGILRVGSADSTAPGIVRVGFGVELFSLGDFVVEGDQHTRFAGVLSVSGSPIDFVELWLNVRATSNDNSETDPNLIQAQGDLQLGIKGFYPFAGFASVGVDAQLTLLSGIGEAGYDFGASEGRFRLLLTGDLTKTPEKLPLRFHLNAGYIADNSSQLLEGQELSVAEQFALGVSDYNRVLVGVGVEVPVPYVTPYVEYSVEFPLDYLATPGVVIAGQGLRAAQAVTEASNVTAHPAVQRVIPQRLTPGVRIRPFDNFTFDLAVEIGLTPDKAVGVPVVPDYNVVSMVTYAIDPFATGGPSGPPMAVPVVIPEATESGGRVAGLIRDAGSGEPIEDAIIHFDGGLPAATNASGAFASGALATGPARVTVTAEGYEPAETELSLVEGETAELELSLEPRVVIGQVAGLVMDASGAPLSGAEVRSVHSEGGEPQVVSTGGDGRFALSLTEGENRVVVTAGGYLRTGRLVEVKAGETSSDIALQLTPRGEVGAKVDGDAIVLPEPLVYAKGEVPPNASARRGLDLVADLLLADAALKVEVGGHTDSRGNASDNQEVSTKRAQAARQYLLERGVLPAQITATGYGSTQPVAPNLTRAGRERNRRIDFAVR